MTGKPVFTASEREKVLFPDPAIPVTRTRRPILTVASLIDGQSPLSVKSSESSSSTDRRSCLRPGGHHDSPINHHRGGRCAMNAPASITVTPVRVADLLVAEDERMPV